MANQGNITEVQLPNGDSYTIKDPTVENIGIDSEYITANQEVVLTVGALVDADNTEY